MWFFGWKGASGFSASFTAEQVTQGINGNIWYELELQLGDRNLGKGDRMWFLGWKGASGFSASSTAEQVTQGIDVNIWNKREYKVAKLQALFDYCFVLIAIRVTVRMWIFGWKGPSGFSASSTAEQVTQGIDGSSLTAIVTGASSGLGVETTRVLALRGVHVVMAVRNVETGMNVKETILKEIPTAKIDVMELDLCSMASVRKFAAEYNSSGHPLNILMNNAAVMATPFMLSKDNIELQFATNHLGHFLLTNLLLETMKKTVREFNREGRIVNVSSEGHRNPYREGIIFDKLNDKSRYNGVSAYGQSKLANILHANELAKRLKEEGVEITVNSLHPGVIGTNLLRYHSYMNAIVNVVGKYFLKNVPQGAATQCYVALHPQVKGITGEYFMDSNKAKPSSLAQDFKLAKKLWEFSLRLTNIPK